ncbi:AMP-binding protein [Microbulbifer mangrovi]|uniref:AMP-binding protein n=1 Tax=Microbulbifer mangrovi TaxID=927787 RepID=UPI00099076B0|nr:AMP-binding protein [Microbulbifer mangrovi]
MTGYFDTERYPTLSEDGCRMLQFLREHPQAPHYRNQSGNRLQVEDLIALEAFEQQEACRRPEWSTQQPPDWLDSFIARAWHEVPYYRAQGATPRFADIEPVSRADFSRDIAAFVPDSVPTERLMNFRTTGTSGNPLLLPSHPRVAASYLSFHRRALRRIGIELTPGPQQVGVVLVGFQQRCFTYVSVTPQMGESGLAKINLHPNDWRDPADRAAYLDDLNPEVYTGDPLSFAELLTLPLKARPRALISVGMMLSNGMRATLEDHFSAPVLDIYSMNEAGPIGVYDRELNGHLLLQPDLYIEVLDPQGQPVATGERGEITLTGGFNFCLPLVRYRTGDFAALHFTNEGPLLADLSGRKPVRFRSASGHWLNNIDITHALQHLPLAQFALHQNHDATLHLRLAPASMMYAESARQSLQALFETPDITVGTIDSEDKVLQYTSNLEGAAI